MAERYLLYGRLRLLAERGRIRRSMCLEVRAMEPIPAPMLYGERDEPSTAQLQRGDLSTTALYSRLRRRRVLGVLGPRPSCMTSYIPPPTMPMEQFQTEE